MSELLSSTTIVPAGHPIDTLLTEHRLMLELARDLRNCAQRLRAAGAEAAREGIEALRRIAAALKESESHYQREENALFPCLERHGIQGPPRVMWMEHDQIRPLKKRIRGLIDAADATPSGELGRELEQAGAALADMLDTHFQKENNILFQAALNVISQEEWREIREQCDDIGYPSFTPRPNSATEPAVAGRQGTASSGDGEVAFESGALPKDVLEALLNTLPLDITFVDDQNTVRYFSQPKDRIFVRTKGVIGRNVQQCHPPKSFHVVSQIVDDFRTGKRDGAEFWIQSDGHMIHIRFFAVRDKQGKYLGCVEVTQDITEARKLEGEKRLL